MSERPRLDAFTMVLLRRRAEAPRMSEAELDELQTKHLPVDVAVMHRSREIAAA